MKRKLEEIEVPRKKLKKEVKRLLKGNVDLKKKKIRRALETNFSLPKKTLDPAKEALDKLIMKIRSKLKSEVTGIIDSTSTNQRFGSTIKKKRGFVAARHLFFFRVSSGKLYFFFPS